MQVTLILMTTESGRLFPRQSTNNKVIYLYMNTRIKYKRHVFYLKQSGVSHTGQLCIAKHWFDFHYTALTAKSFIFFQLPVSFYLFLMLLYFSSILQCCWMLMSRKWYKTTVSFRLKVQVWKVQLFSILEFPKKLYIWHCPAIQRSVKYFTSCPPLA